MSDIFTHFTHLHCYPTMILGTAKEIHSIQRNSRQLFLSTISNDRDSRKQDSGAVLIIHTFIWSPLNLTAYQLCALRLWKQFTSWCLKDHEIINLDICQGTIAISQSAQSLTSLIGQQKALNQYLRKCGHVSIRSSLGLMTQWVM